MRKQSEFRPIEFGQRFLFSEKQSFLQGKVEKIINIVIILKSLKTRLGFVTPNNQAKAPAAFIFKKKL